MATAYKRGNKIVYIANNWVYADDKTSIIDNERPCTRCGRMPTPEGYDACIGFVEGVSSACCGHGIAEPYQVKGDKK